MKCAICGTDLSKDLYASVMQASLCSVCTVKFIGGGTETLARIENIRRLLGLKDGEYLVQDNAQEAKIILGRK